MAAADPPSTAPAAAHAPAWDEEQCTTALAHLERLKSQLDELRLTIPRVVQPFYSPPTPSMFAAFRDNLTTSQNDIKVFRKEWQAKETQSAFEYSTKSLKANPDLSNSVDVGKYGWVERERRAMKKDGEEGTEGENQGGEEMVETLNEEDITRVVQEWKVNYEQIGLERKDGDRDLTISFIASSLKQRYHVLITQEGNGSHKLHVECLGTSERELAISRCIKARPKTNDLRFLLDMLAAYKTVKGTTCAKCGSMFDANTMGTVARRSREVVGEQKADVVWEAFHEGCLL